MTDVEWHDLRTDVTRYVARRVPSSAVDDVVQDVLERVYRGVGELADEERLGPWLNTLARRTVADHFRRVDSERRRIEAAAREPIEPPASEDDPAELLSACVRPFIEGLPEPYREALILTEIEGLSQREAAERCGVSRSVMKSRVQRGRTMLRGEVEACCRVSLDARNRVVGFTPRDQPDCCES